MPQSAGMDGERAKVFLSRGKRNQCKRDFYVTFTDFVVFLQALSVLLFKRCMQIHCGLAGTCSMGLQAWMLLNLKSK